MTEQNIDADEWRQNQAIFNSYCSKLCALIDVTTPNGCSGTMCRSMPCACGRKIPAGIPSEYRMTSWAVCPDCVRAKRFIEALDHKLNEAYPEAGPELLSVARAMAQPKRERFDARAARTTE